MENETTLTIENENALINSPTISGEWLLDFSRVDNSPLTHEEKELDNSFLSEVGSKASTLESMLFREFAFLFELFREPMIKRAILIAASSLNNHGVNSHLSTSQEYQELCGYVAPFVDLFLSWREERYRGGKLKGHDYYSTKWTEQIVVLEGYFERVDCYFQRFCKEYPQENIEYLTRERNDFKYDIERFRKIIDNKKRSCARKRGASAMTLEIDLLNGFFEKLVAKEVINYCLEDKAKRLEMAELMKSTSELAEMLRG